MAYEFYNPNPIGRLNVGDCAPRALAKALDIDWDSASVLLCNAAIKMGEIENNKSVLAAVLRQNGFYRKVIPDTCPDCYTAEDFCKDNPSGIFILGFGEHVCCIKDGVIYDTDDSRSMIPLLYWYKKQEKQDN